MQKPSLAKQINIHITLAQLVLSVLTVLLLTCVPAAAQSDWRLFGGFSYGRAEMSPQLEPFGVGHINAIGWGASVTQYMSWARWFGATAEASGVYKNPTITIPANYFGEGDPATNLVYENYVRGTAYTAMFGPSFAYRRNSIIEPFAHILFGGVHGEVKLTSKGESLVGTSANASGWEFGYALGGGADFKISKLVALRGQADWIRSTFPDADKDRQNHIRILGGLVFRLSE